MKNYKLSKEEKACIKSYVKMAKVKVWRKPSEYEVCKMFGINMVAELREATQNYIDEVWWSL